MRICIVGCGAVGSLFAVNLAQLDDLEVWAYDLAQEHVDAINRDGLRLSGAGDVIGRPHATSDAGELPACDFGIVATKAMHTSAAIAATAHAFGEGSVATVQNGLGNEEALAEHVERVIRGTTFPATSSGTSRATRRSARSSPGRPRPQRSSGWPLPVPAPACRPRRSRTRAGRNGARSSSTLRRTRSAL
jgi:ketopantoate reductase